ncbi:MAG: hypothetical protein K2N22_04870 [Clostridia bacterium]|nr:hypothetical protein [Clostridia bacterium]
MDFFEYASFARYFVSANNYWVSYLVGGLCFLIVFVFQAVALYTIAVKAGYKNKWMAFIPFFNTYYIGVCAQKNKCFNAINAKVIGAIAAVFEFVLVAAYIVNDVAYSYVKEYQYYVEVPYALGTYLEPHLGEVPAHLAWAAWCYNYLGTVLNFVELAYLLVNVALLICFFQTYACRRYLVFAITSVLFPISGILFFVVRNNKGVNYRDYMRAEQARQYQMYQQYQQYYHRQQQQNYDRNPYESPYDKNPYEGAPQNNQRQNPPEDPFGGLGESGGNDKNSTPFDDFNN